MTPPVFLALQSEAGAIVRGPDDRERLSATDLQREMRRDGAPPVHLPLGFEG